MKNYKNYLFVALGFVIAAITFSFTNVGSQVQAQLQSKVLVINPKESPVPAITTVASQQWEYRNVTIDADLLEKKDVNRDSNALRDLNQLGKEGFELVSISPIPSSGDGGTMKKCIAVLKRPKDYSKP